MFVKNFVLILICLISFNSAFAKVEVLQIGPKLSHPWGISFIDNSNVIITERGGDLSIINLKTGKLSKINDAPQVFNVGQGGLLDVHAEKLDSKINIYLCYSKFDPPVKSYTILEKSVLEENTLQDNKIIFSTKVSSGLPIHYGCRIAISEHHIYLSLGERGQRHKAQNPELYEGSIIRLNLNNDKVDKNQFNSKWLSEIFSIGHRNPQGLTINQIDHTIWSHEHGPQGGDEINIIEGGKNYGWPKVTQGEEYGGGEIGANSLPEFKDPIWVWTPSIAPSGMVFYNGKMFPELNNHLLVGSLKFKQIYALEIRDNKPTNEVKILIQNYGRIRDIEIMSDGSILFITDENEGGLYRIYKKQ